MSKPYIRTVKNVDKKSGEFMLTNKHKSVKLLNIGASHIIEELDEYKFYADDIQIKSDIDLEIEVFNPETNTSSRFPHKADY